MRAAALVLVLATLVVGRAWAASEEPPPDVKLLLDLDLLIQAEPHERDLLRRMSVVERLRLLELFRLLEGRPATAAPRRPAAEEGSR